MLTRGIQMHTVKKVSAQTRKLERPVAPYTQSKWNTLYRLCNFSLVDPIEWPNPQINFASMKVQLAVPSEYN